jgi:hypothetical protein
MIVVLGLIILVAVVVVAVAGVLGNGGTGHALTHFSVLGYHVTGSTGTLFLYGIVLGAVGLFGLSLLLAGARRTSRRGSAARRGLKQSRRETAVASQERDDLIDQREAARAETASPPEAETASPPENGVPSGNGQHGPADGRPGWLHRFGQRSAPEEAAVAPAEPLAGQPASDIPADSPGPAGDAVAAGQT